MLYYVFVLIRINVHVRAIIVVFNLQEEFNLGLILTDVILTPYSRKHNQQNKYE